MRTWTLAIFPALGSLASGVRVMWLLCVARPSSLSFCSLCSRRDDRSQAPVARMRHRGASVLRLGKDRDGIAWQGIGCDVEGALS